MPHHWWIPVFADAPGQPPAFPPAEAPTQTQETNYGLYQQEGSDRQQWIEDASAPNCLILPSTLTVAQLQSAYRVRSWQGNHALGEINNLFSQVGLPVESPSATDSAYYEKRIHDMNLSWNGYIGPGVIMLDNIIRGEGAPQISDVSLAFIEHTTLSKRFDMSLWAPFLMHVRFPSLNLFTVISNTRSIGGGLGSTARLSTRLCWVLGLVRLSVILCSVRFPGALGGFPGFIPRFIGIARLLICTLR